MTTPAPAEDVSASTSMSGLRRLAFGLAALFWAADQASKAWALQALADGRRLTIVEGWLDFILIRNPGAAFNATFVSTYVLTAIAVVASLALVWIIRGCVDRLWAIALGLMLSGALGNLTDRLIRDPGYGKGHVVDFITVYHVPFFEVFPSFNVADSAITVAACIIIIQSLRGISYDGATQ